MIPSRFFTGSRPHTLGSWRLSFGPETCLISAQRQEFAGNSSVPVRAALLAAPILLKHLPMGKLGKGPDPVPQLSLQQFKRPA